MRHTWKVLFFAVVIVCGIRGKIYTPNEFAKILHEAKISDWDIPAVVCIAHNVSGLNSSFVRETYEEDLDMNVTLFGVFGLSEHEINCDLGAEELTDDDVVDDVACAVDILASGLSEHHSISGSFEYLFGHSKVDVNRCFDWWEKLPPTIHDVRDEPTSTSPPPPPPKPTPPTSLPDDHPTIVRTCTCEYGKSSTTFNFSLIWFNLTLILLAYILWTAFRQQRRHTSSASSSDDTAYLCSDLQHD